MKPETVRKADDAGRAGGCGTLQAQGVIFDMDGVIFDTERFYLDCCIPAAEKLGMERIEEVSFRCIGLTKEETDRRMLEFYGPDAPLDDFEREVSAVFRQRYEELKHMPVKPGAEALLSWLKQRQVPLALASSTRIAIVTQELKDAGLYGYFDVIIGGDMVSRSKPEPDIFLKAAQLLKERFRPERAPDASDRSTPERAPDVSDAGPREQAPDAGPPKAGGIFLVIEDSFHGIRAARRAEMIPLMVPDLLQPDEEIRNLACRVFSSLDEVRDWMIRQDENGLFAAQLNPLRTERKMV